jgi:hypothetical protein
MQTSMPVAQRYHVPVKRNGASGEQEGDSSPAQTTSTSLPVASMGEKITITAPRVQRDGDDSNANSNDDTEPDWERLAEKILPLLKERILSDRDRLGW